MGRLAWRPSTPIAAARETPKLTQRCHSGFQASTASISMKVANASLSQMPFHHTMVTRSPNHMWASSCATTSATRSQLGVGRRRLVDQQRGLAEGDRAQVLHGARREVGDRQQVELVARVRHAVVALEEVEAEGAGRPGVARPGGACPARTRRGAASCPTMHRLGRLELADDERDQVGGHPDGVGERHRPPAGARRLLADGRGVRDRGVAVGHHQRHAEHRLEGGLVPAREARGARRWPRTASPP